MAERLNRLSNPSAAFRPAILQRSRSLWWRSRSNRASVLVNGLQFGLERAVEFQEVSDFYVTAQSGVLFGCPTEGVCSIDFSSGAMLVSPRWSTWIGVTAFITSPTSLRTSLPPRCLPTKPFYASRPTSSHASRRARRYVTLSPMLATNAHLARRVER